MKTNKLSIAMAALVLGLQLGSPVMASISEVDFARIEQVIAAGDIDALLALLAAYPELLNIQGALGDALRAFSANPSQATLASIASQSGGPLSVVLAKSFGQPAASIY